MVEAKITLPDGTKIVANGTPGEIMELQEAFSEVVKGKADKTLKKTGKGKKVKSSSKLGPLSRVRSLVEEDFFRQKRTLEEVRKALEVKAIFYKHSDISPSLIRLVKKGELRRMKEEKQWRYVNS